MSVQITATQKIGGVVFEVSGASEIEVINMLSKINRIANGKQ